MTPFDELQREHERLLDKAEVADVIAYIDRARTLAAQIGDPRQRDQLRANLRYWASYVYDRSGTYPTTTLLPAAASEEVTKSSGSSIEPERIVKAAAPAPRKIWLWLVGVAVVALLTLAVFMSQFSLMRSTPTQPLPVGAATATVMKDTATERLRALPITTDLYDKPGSDPDAQVLGRMQAGSQFYAVARTTDAHWLKITTADGVNGWIKATASGLIPDQVGQLPSAAIVIVSTPTSTSTPFPTSTPYATPGAATTSGASAGDLPSATPTAAVMRPTPTPFSVRPATPTGSEPPSQAVPLQLSHQVVTYGPSPFNADAWVIAIQLLATGGDNHYVFWVNGQRLDGDRYTIESVACRAVTLTLGVTSQGQAVRREVTLKSPLTTCK